MVKINKSLCAAHNILIEINIMSFITGHYFLLVDAVEVRMSRNL